MDFVDMVDNSTHVTLGAPSEKTDIIRSVVAAWAPEAIIEVGSSDRLASKGLGGQFALPVLSICADPTDEFATPERDNARHDVYISSLESLFSSQQPLPIPENQRVLAILHGRGRSQYELRSVLRALFGRYQRIIVFVDETIIPDDENQFELVRQGSARNVRLLYGIVPPGFEIYFPNLSKIGNTNTASGFCVIGRAAPLDRIPPLRGGDYHTWLLVQTATSDQREAAGGEGGSTVLREKDRIISALRGDIATIALDAAMQRQSLFKELVAKERVIQELAGALKATTDPAPSKSTT